MALLSLLVLMALLIVSLFNRINIGFLALVASIGLAQLADFETSSALLSRFPSELFLTLLGICYLFGIVEANGTLETLFQYLLRATRGSLRFLPWTLFAFSATISAIGAGNIAAAALLAPLAMHASRQYRLSPLLMAVMIGNGANAGALSPLSPAGIVLSLKVRTAGFSIDPWAIFYWSLSVHFFVSFVAYFLLSGHRSKAKAELEISAASMSREQWTTLLILLSMLAGVVSGKLHIALLALLGALALNLLFPQHEDSRLSRVPWTTLLMVCGISLLVSLMELLGGSDLLSSWLSYYVSPSWLPGGLALISGFLSSFSSSTAVVMPTFIPLVPKLIDASSGIAAFKLTASIAIGAHLVDVSPLSTIGALCLAASKEGAPRLRLYKQMLTWGLCMIPLGALLCQLLFAF